VLIGVASVFPQGGDRERHWSEPVTRQVQPPADHADAPSDE
jgi:hypothetical protein